ncbi:hypothetical protein [Streptomyces canus]|uniref:hypothetical protein n=1 Tax=Streptomyces canus TaxID=58343 RepID=UPI003247D5FF
MNPHIEIRPEVVARLVGVKACEPLPEATAAEREAARAYLVRAIEHSEELNAARRRTVELLTLYGYLLPAGSTVGEVMDRMPKPIAEEFTGLLDRTEPDGSY